MLKKEYSVDKGIKFEGIVLDFSNKSFLKKQNPVQAYFEKIQYGFQNKQKRIAQLERSYGSRKTTLFQEKTRADER